jgi:predicted flavoprotein YhiN
LEERGFLSDFSALLTGIKACELKLAAPRPLEEAISSAGGVAWDELDDELMLKKYPGMFCAGEMIDWDAPTGGYLLQGCFATGTIAGQSAAKWIAQDR